MLTNDVVSFEQLGPDFFPIYEICQPSCGTTLLVSLTNISENIIILPCPNIIWLKFLLQKYFKCCNFDNSSAYDIK